jgi:hypothetical protein
MAILALDKPIASVTGVKNLKDGHPVFLIVGADDSHLVVKQESTTDTANLRRNFLVMGMASPKARAVILTPGEVDELRAPVRKRIAFKRKGGPDLTADESTLQKYLGQGGTWFKMLEAEGYTDLERVARQFLEGDKTGVRARATALNNSGGLESLGKIVAADLFNNNNDRFMPKTPGKIYVKANGGETEFSVKSLANIGNVMAALSGSKLKVIGLDSWDPYQELVSNLNVAPGGDWLGGLLAPHKESARLDFAVDIRDDLNLLLGTRNRSFDFLQQTRLNPDAAQRIAKGMNTMRKLLIDRMVRSLKQPNPPAGLAARLTVVRGK